MSEAPSNWREIERAWRDAGLPEWFLGNGGTNHKLYAFAAATAEMFSDPDDGDTVQPEPYEVIGTTYDGVQILAPKTRSSRFTTEEIRAAIAKAMGASPAQASGSRKTETDHG